MLASQLKAGDVLAAGFVVKVERFGEVKAVQDKESKLKPGRFTGYVALARTIAEQAEQCYSPTEGSVRITFADRRTSTLRADWQVDVLNERQAA